MPPNHRRSTGARSMARISSAGVTWLAVRPKAALICGVTAIDLTLRSKTPPPFEISVMS